MTIDLGKRYQGCLLASACGDALGGVVEFDSREKIAASYPEGLRDFVGGGWLHLAPGEVTDDTQMTMMLAESLVAHPAGDLDDLAQRFIAWQASGPKDIGYTTDHAIHELANGTPWDKAGQIVAEARGPNSAGNGAVMRCSPIALRFRNDRGKLRSVSLDMTRITHADRRCIWSAVAINQGVVHLLNGGSRDDLLRAAIEEIEDADVVAAAERSATMTRDQVKSGGFVLDTMSAAFCSFLSTATLEDAIVEAVALGLDTDTTAAVAGAIAGAHYGLDAIPDRWLQLLQPRETIQQLADQLLAASNATTAAQPA
jgi:ADP-ribosyl-[dinitrogen reductase] hydrolase